MTTRPLRIVRLGTRPYRPVAEFQRELVRARLKGTITEDLLLLVEHPPVVTLGRGTRSTSMPVSAEGLRLRGFEVVEVERGGDVTVHAPGQLVGYPILDLGGHRRDLHWYLRQLEETLIDALVAGGVAADRQEGFTGVWVGDRKIASIGVHVKQWVTMHGFALNLTTDLALFDVIVPCGIAGVRMTSVALELGRPLDHSQTATWWTAVADAFAGGFEREPVPTPLERLPIPFGPGAVA